MAERFLSARPHGPNAPTPLSPREQRSPSDRPGAVQGAKRRSEPLTARIDLESSTTRGKGIVVDDLHKRAVLQLPDSGRIFKGLGVAKRYCRRDSHGDIFVQC